MEKRGVCEGENEVPKPVPKQATDSSATSRPSCGQDAASKAAEAAARPPKPAK